MYNNFNVLISFNKKKPIWRNLLITIGFLIIFTLGFSTTYLTIKLSKIFTKNPLSESNVKLNVYANASPRPIEEIDKTQGVYNFLLLGYGGEDHDGGLLTDSIIVVHININTHKAVLISIPRDLWVTGNYKINASGINGFQNIGPIIQNITGLPINYFIAVDFRGFEKIIDDIGGVNINITKTLDDQFYPIKGEENNTCGFSNEKINSLKAQYSGFELERQFTCRYEHLHFDQGPTTLDGKTALKFSRSRHGDSDFGRSARQFSILIGIKNKLLEFKSLAKLDDIINILSQSVKTDLDAGTIKSLVQLLKEPESYSIEQIQLNTNNFLVEGKGPNGEYILYPKAGIFNYSEIKKYIEKNI